jgi:hypothetical protein
VFLYVLRPTVVATHNRDQTTIAVNTHVGWILPPLNDRISSSCNSCQLVADRQNSVEFSGSSSRSFFPACDGIPGDPHDPGDGGLADPLYAHSGDVIEGVPAMLKPEVRGASQGRRGHPAGSTPITARPAPLGNNEAVADDVSSILLAMEPAIGVPACSVSNRMSHKESPEVLPKKCSVSVATSRNYVQVANSK